MKKAWRFLPGAIGLAAVAHAGPPASPVGDWDPDYQYRAGHWTAWKAVGEVDWRADGDEIVARPRSPTAQGWLILEKPLQDAAVFTEFRCTAPCNVGLGLRVHEATPGIYVADLMSFGSQTESLTEVTFDTRGRETARAKLESWNGQSRFATPVGGSAAGAAPSVPGVDNPLRPLFPKVTAPLIAPGREGQSVTGPAPSAPSFAPPGFAGAQGRDARFQPGGWNALRATVDTNVAFASLNGARRTTGVTLDDGNGYGGIALYVGPGSGEVRFRNVAYKDIGRQSVPIEQVSPAFRMQKLDDFSYAWDAAAADVDRDGHQDVIAGPYVYYGPDFTVRREIYIASTFSPGNQYAANMVTYAGDFTGDGWPDVLVTEARQLALLENPRGEARRWSRTMAIPGNVSEIPLLDDLDNDGTPEVVIVQGGRVAFAQPKRGNATAPWPIFFVSEPGQATLHSFGVGDVDGDGRKDILQVKGWWEQPAGGITGGKWIFHPYLFGDPEQPASSPEGGGNMAVIDVNGDGLNDVISTVNAHGWGLAWYEQSRAGGSITFIPHLITGDHTRHNPGGLAVSELHAGAFVADVNKDGVVDFFTGKKKWAHLDSHADPDPSGPAYLLLFRGVRDRNAPGGVRFEPEVIHNRSGAGSGLKVTDLNADGAVDVVTSGVNGTFVFFGKSPSRKR